MRIFCIFVLIIVYVNAYSENTYLKNSPKEDALSFLEKSSIGIDDNPSSIGLSYAMKDNYHYKRNKKIISLYKSGKQMDRIDGTLVKRLSKKFNLATITIRNILKKNNVDIPYKKRTLTIGEEKRLIKDYKENILPYPELSLKYKINYLRIRDIIATNGIRFRTVKNRRTKATIIHKKQEKKIISLYISGVGLKKIAKKYRVDYNRIKKILLSNDITLRTVGQSIARYSINENFFDKMGKEPSWLLGLFAADGHIRKNVLSIAQSNSKGLKLIKYIKKVLDYDGKIYVNHPKVGGTQYVLAFSSQKISSIFRKFHFTNNKTINYTLPNVRKMDFKNFLRGYFDGDGSVGVYGYNSFKDKKRYYLHANICGTEKFLMECNKIIPVKGNLLKAKRISRPSENIFSLKWNGKKAIKFLEWLWSDKNLWTWYKHDIFEKFKTKFRNKIYIGSGIWK